MKTRRTHSITIVVAALLACEPEPSKVSGYTYCSADAECPSGQVCETDDTKDSYCTPTCESEEMCPTQVGCPSLSPVGKQCYVEPGDQGIERGECDQFQGYYGPNSCRDASEDDGSCIPNGNACGPSNTYVDACCSGFCGETGTCK